MFKAEEKCNRSRRRTMRDYVKRAQDNPQLVMQRGVAVSPAMRFAAQATGYAQLGIEFQRVGLDCGVVFGYDPASDIPEELLIARVSRLAVARFCGPVAEWASLRFSADLYNSAREDREWAIAQKRALAHRGTVPESLDFLTAAWRGAAEFLNNLRVLRAIELTAGRIAAQSYICDETVVDAICLARASHRPNLPIFCWRP